MSRNKKTITSTALLASPRALEMVVAFLNEVVGQIPETPDYWGACEQCYRNTDKADDIIDEVLAQNAAGQGRGVAVASRRLLAQTLEVPSDRGTEGCGDPCAGGNGHDPRNGDAGRERSTETPQRSDGLR